MKKVDTIAIVLILIGAFNWGLIGFVDFNLIDYLVVRFWLVRAIYALVGLAAIYLVVNWNTVRGRSRG